jgi:D-alanine-D-alanine ligase
MLKKCRKVLLVAEIVETHKNSDAMSRELEKTEITYLNELKSSFKKLGIDIIHITRPQDIATSIGEDETIVLSLWSGENSKFRKALVPSICETLGVRYIGSDPYVSIICQDKALSKVFSEKYNIHAANGFLVNSASNLGILPSLSTPIVIKPNAEGGSIGIDDSSLVDNIHQAVEKAKSLMEHFSCDILIEEFLPGKEVSFVIAGNCKDIVFFEAVELYLIEEPDMLNSSIFGVDKKKSKNRQLTVEHRLVTHLIPEEVKSNIRALFLGLQKCEALRVDGKLLDNDFKLIELTPDIHLGADATFASAFRLAGYSHTEMLKILLDLV